MIKKFLRFIILNVKDRKIISRYHELEISQYNKKEKVVNSQLVQLNNLLNHAYNNVPHYRNIIKGSGLVIDERIELKSINQLSELPILTKNIIRKEKNNLYSTDIDARNASRNTSGGSTGEPVVFMQDSNYLMSNLANSYLAKSWRGAGLYDNTIILWGAERDTFEGKKPFKLAIKDFFLNTLRLNTFVLSNEDKRRYLERLNKVKPKLIIAYIQSIYELAKYARQNNLEMKQQNAIHAAAGTVHPFMRDEIESVFGCRVFNHYGSREAGAIASECLAHRGLHIMMEHTLVEIVDDRGMPCKPGESGDIIITTLNNYSMPLIRYKIGDVGVLSNESNCECGCNYPKLEKITGRSTDLFKTSTGKVVDGEFFTHLFYFVEGIKLFQVIQEELDHITVKIVKDSEVSSWSLREINKKIKIVMGENCKVIFEYVEDIPKTATGKYLYTSSKI